MKNKLGTLVLAGTIAMSTATTGFAATLDFTNTKDSSKSYTALEVATSRSAVLDIVTDKASYLVEGKDGKNYKLVDVQEQVSKGLTFEEAIEQGKLTPVDAPVEGELKVVEVSAINANYVVVKITAPEEDLLAQEVEVKNGAGVVVPVKPLDIAAGDETAEFEFVTAVKAADLKGVWTVNGQPYDLDLFNKIVDFLEASTQIELNEALVALNLDNYDAANITEYFTAQQKLVGTVEATELKLADIQKLVDDANAKVAEGKDEAALIKAIKDAKTANNQVAFLEALNNAGLTQVNPDWVAVATNGYFDKFTGTETSLKDIQKDVINAANETIILSKVTDTGIDKAKLTASKELIEQYAPLTDKGVINNSTIKTRLEKIEEQLAVVAVLEATTPTALKARLTELAELVNTSSSTIVDMKNYKDANGKAYVKAIADETDKATKLATANALNTLLTTVNNAQETSLVTAVTTAATAIKDATDPITADQKAALIKALNDLGVKQVAEGNIDEYIDTTIVTALSTIADLDAAQTQVDTANLNAVTNADENTIIDKLNVFGLDNIVEANAKAYADDLVVPTVGADNKATITAVKNAVAVVNKQVIVDAQVKAINEAKDVATVKAALDALADVDEAAGYLTIRSVDRDFVAAHVLENRPATVGYADETAIQTEIGADKTTGALKAHSEALTAINAIEYTSTPVEIVAALEKMLDEDFNALSNTEKTAKAEAFQAKLTFGDDQKLATPFRTLADVKALLK